MCSDMSGLLLDFAFSFGTSSLINVPRISSLSHGPDAIFSS